MQCASAAALDGAVDMTPPGRRLISIGGEGEVLLPASALVKTLALQSIRRSRARHIWPQSNI